MKLTTSARARLYAITGVACIIWLVQTLIEAHGDGTLFSWATIVLALCLIVVSVYCVANAVRDWNADARGTRRTDIRDNGGNTGGRT